MAEKENELLRAVNMERVVKVSILGYFKEQLKKIFAPKDLVTTTKEGLMSKGDKTKLDGIAEHANNYVHPETHPATMITEDATHRFVTDTDKTNWNGAKTKADNLEAKLQNMTLAKVNELCDKYKVGTSKTIA